MKHIITFLFLGLYACLIAQPDLNELEEFALSSNLGKCYYIQPLDSTVTETVFLEIEPDIWKTRYTTTTELIKEQGLEEELQSNSSNIIRLMVSPPFQKLVKRKGNNGNPYPASATFSERNEKFFCLVEVPPRYKSFEKVTILQDGKPVNIIKEEKVLTRELVRRGQIRFISKETAAKVTHPNVYEVYKGDWTDLREYLPRCGGDTVKKIKQIQRKLIEEGYDVKVDGVLGKDVREALFDYQRKNGLPQGRLDIETLKKLGIKN